MNMSILNPLQNAAGVGGVLGGAMHGYNQSTDARRVSSIESLFDPHTQTSVKIVSAANGYIVIVAPVDSMYKPSRVLIAPTIEDVRDLITSEMVSKKMEK
jgi:hypothetical protein